MKHLLSALLVLLLLQSSTASAQQSKKITIAPGLVATVVLYPGAADVKVLMAGMDTLSLDVTESIVAQRTIKTADYNFDGKKDFAVATPAADAASYFTYDIFLYNSAEKTFQPLELPGDATSCGAFGNVRLNAGTKSLTTSCRNGGTKMQSDVYTYADAYTLRFVSSKGGEMDEKPEKPERVRKEKDEDEEE